jgi:hypothetical protein
MASGNVLEPTAPEAACKAQQHAPHPSWCDRLQEGPPNDRQISCKRPEKTYVPYCLREALYSRSPGQAAFVGCICGLGGNRALIYSVPSGASGHLQPRGRYSPLSSPPSGRGPTRSIK